MGRAAIGVLILAAACCLQPLYVSSRRIKVQGCGSHAQLPAPDQAGREALSMHVPGTDAPHQHSVQAARLLLTRWVNMGVSSTSIHVGSGPMGICMLHICRFWA